MNRVRTHILQIGGLLIFAALLGGVGIAVYLSGQSQEIRQRASTAGVVDVALSPQSQTYTNNSQASVAITVDSGPTLVRIVNTQFTIATITGDIPDDLSFAIAPLPGVVSVTTTLVPVSGGKRLDATMSNPSNSYSTNGAAFPMGSFHFTPKQTGIMTMTLDPSFAGTIQALDGTQVIQLGGAGTYSFAIPTPSPSPTSTLTPAPTIAPSLTVARTQNLSIAQATPTPTPSPTLLAQVLTTPTPTPVPTTSPSQEILPTTTPIPTLVPTSIPTSLPTNQIAESQTPLVTTQETTTDDLPVSGNGTPTYMLLSIAIACIALGVGLSISSDKYV